VPRLSRWGSCGVSHRCSREHVHGQCGLCAVAANHRAMAASLTRSCRRRCLHACGARIRSSAGAVGHRCSSSMCIRAIAALFELVRRRPRMLDALRPSYWLPVWAAYEPGRSQQVERRRYQPPLLAERVHVAFAARDERARVGSGRTCGWLRQCARCARSTRSSGSTRAWCCSGFYAVFCVF
jgi:hypothetical protein